LWSSCLTIPSAGTIGLCYHAWLLKRIFFLKTNFYRLVPVIPATQEAEIRRIAVEGHSGQIGHETPSTK
jgi:hypothetical protein